MRLPRSRRFVLALVACALVVLVVVTFRGLGPWLVVNEPLAPSDVIFVTDGQTPQRELEGAALYLDGWAPRIAVTLPRDLMSADTRRLSGEPTPQERSVQVLRYRGVPEGAIVRLDRMVDNTEQELQADFDYARAHGFRRVIIVSSPYHTRRIRLMWRSRFEGEIPALVRATRYEPGDPSRWWRSRRPLEAAVHEVFGILNFVLGNPIPTSDRGG